MTELELIKCSYCKKHLRIKILSTQPLKWIPFGNFTSMQYEGLFCSSSCCLQNEKKQNELIFLIDMNPFLDFILNRL